MNVLPQLIKMKVFKFRTLLNKYKFGPFSPQFGVIEGQYLQLTLKFDYIFGFSDDFPTCVPHFKMNHVKQSQKLRL